MEVDTSGCQIVGAGHSGNNLGNHPKMEKVVEHKNYNSWSEIEKKTFLRNCIIHLIQHSTPEASATLHQANTALHRLSVAPLAVQQNQNSRYYTEPMESKPTPTPYG